MNQPVPRPVETIRRLNKRFQGVNKLCEQVLKGKGKLYPSWPSWCFFPSTIWHDVLAASSNIEHSKVWEKEPFAALAFGAIVSWQYTQGIYRIDPTLLEELARTPLTGDLPSDLFKLPQHSIYIETPGFMWENTQQYGFYALFDCKYKEYYPDIDPKTKVLTLIIDAEDRYAGICIILDENTLNLCLETTTQSIKETNTKLGVEGYLTVDEQYEKVKKSTKELGVLLNLLLYVCSDVSEIKNERDPRIRPTIAKLTKVKGDWRLFPPAGYKVWEVGADTGKKLREARKEYKAWCESTGVAYRESRFRSAHWHLYWTGPKTLEQRIPRVRWVYPHLVRYRVPTPEDTVHGTVSP